MITTRWLICAVLFTSMMIAACQKTQTQSVLVTYDVHIVVHSHAEAEELAAKYSNCTVSKR